MPDPFLEEMPRPKPTKHEIGQDLSTLSVYELTDRIGQLEAEIERLKETRAAKEKSKNSADSFFRG